MLRRGALSKGARAAHPLRKPCSGFSAGSVSMAATRRRPTCLLPVAGGVAGCFHARRCGLAARHATSCFACVSLRYCGLRRCGLHLLRRAVVSRYARVERPPKPCLRFPVGYTLCPSTAGSRDDAVRNAAVSPGPIARFARVSPRSHGSRPDGQRGCVAQLCPQMPVPRARCASPLATPFSPGRPSSPHVCVRCVVCVSVALRRLGALPSAQRCELAARHAT